MLVAADIPVIINNFDRLACLERLLAWLQQNGSRRIVILDNASTYQKLLDAYGRVARQSVEVIHLGANIGALALWDCDLLRRLGIVSEYIYTDSDVVPAADCPGDAIAHLARALAAHPRVKKIGLGLRLDNLPRHYRHRDAVLLWERQFWRRPAAPGLMFAPVDTTFALYRAHAPHGMAADNLRTTWPYVAEHLGWYSDSANPDEEEQHYARTARRDITSWTGETLRPDFARGLPAMRTPRLMQLGHGHDTWPGWEQGHDADFAALPESSFDGFHSLGGLPSPETMQALHRLAKPNARALIHVDRTTWNPREVLVSGAPAYENSDCTYAGDWAISAVSHFPSGAWLAHLFAVKPVRARVKSLEVWQEPVNVADDLSPEPEFDVV